MSDDKEASLKRIEIKRVTSRQVIDDLAKEVFDLTLLLDRAENLIRQMRDTIATRPVIKDAALLTAADEFLAMR